MPLAEFQWPRVSEMRWMMVEPVLPLLCHYSAALLCEGRLEKPPAPFQGFVYSLGLTPSTRVTTFPGIQQARQG